MTFWQENFGFIKDVYESRTSKLVDLMDKTDRAIASILADKIYTSHEFKKIKETFIGLARNLEQPDTKDWLTMTKDTLMNDRGGPEMDEETKKLTSILARYDETMPKVNDTKAVVDCLWRAYQFTDELAPYFEFMEDMKTKSTKDITTDSSTQTDEHIEKQEKFLDQMDKKKKSVQEQTAKGEKIQADPKSPKFLEGHVNKLKDLWIEANKCAEERLALLKENSSSWEKYDRNKENLVDQLTEALNEYKDTKKIFNNSQNTSDYAYRMDTAADLRKRIEESHKGMAEAYENLSQLLGQNKKTELAEEVESFKAQTNILNTIDEKLEFLKGFNAQLKTFEENVKTMEDFNTNARKRMDDLLSPDSKLAPEERVMYTMELQSDIDVEMDKRNKLAEEWKTLEPKEDNEKGPEPDDFVNRLKTMGEFQQSLMDEVQQEGEKFGEDIKHLADFTSGVKKFEPWIATSEAKKSKGMSKPKNLKEAKEYLAEVEKWQEETDAMHKTLMDAHDAAQRMTEHKDPDAKHAANMKRWEAIDKTCKDWTSKLKSMVDVWQKQAETAAKVTAAIAAKPDEEGEEGAPEMNLEDLEKHLESLKKMFVEKQKMMEQLEKTKQAGEAAAAEQVKDAEGAAS